MSLILIFLQSDNDAVCTVGCKRVDLSYQPFILFTICEEVWYEQTLNRCNRNVEFDSMTTREGNLYMCEISCDVENNIISYYRH